MGDTFDRSPVNDKKMSNANSNTAYRADRPDTPERSMSDHSSTIVRKKEYLKPDYLRKYHNKEFTRKESSSKTNKEYIDRIPLVSIDKHMLTSQSKDNKTCQDVLKEPKQQFNTANNIQSKIKGMENIKKCNDIDKQFIELLIHSPADRVSEVFRSRQDDFIKLIKKCLTDYSITPVVFSMLANVSKDNLNFSSLNHILRDSQFIDIVAVPYLLSLVGSACDHIDTVRDAVSLIKVTADNSSSSIVSFYGIFTVLSNLIKEIRDSGLCENSALRDFVDFEHIRMKINQNRRKQMKEKRNKEDGMVPPENFRQISVYPTAYDILINKIPFLRKNKTFGAYNDLEHYLDVQFRLLREDFVAPLRDSIIKFKKSEEDQRDKKRMSEVLRLYENVTLVDTKVSIDGICHILKFDTANTKHVNWEQSKRLIFGSLLCLSYDLFETIYFATVTNRKTEDLEKGVVDIKFTCGIDKVCRVAERSFLMVESEAYFEAYKHNLMALKCITELPFAEHIVDCSEHIKAPAYLIKEEPVIYDLSSLAVENMLLRVNKSGSIRIELKTDEADAAKHRKFRKSCFQSAIQHDLTLTDIEVLNDASWPTKSKLKLDDSQYRALKNALQHRFSIIQGPPGTGKTFVGLKIAKALLANKHIWSTTKKHPMLVVCYTNHALDQFLSGIIDFFKGEIVRVGGRSSNESVKELNINRLYKHVSQEIKETKSALHTVASLIQIQIVKIKGKIHGCGKNILDLDELKQYMDGYYNLLVNESTLGLCEETGDCLARWLQSTCLPNTTVIDSRHEEIENRPTVNSTLTEDYSFNESCSKTVSPIRNTIWTLEMDQRWKLYDSWIEEMKVDLTERLREYEHVYDTICQEIQLLDKKKQTEALQQADVIGMTTTGAARYHTILQKISPKIVIVEEAAEVLEGHIVTSVSEQCEHLILIGDHKQLRPSPAVYQLAKKFNFDVSLFEGMINNNVHHECLECQHRMRPEISRLVRLVYPKLKDHDTVLNKPDIKGVSSNVFFISHTNAENIDGDRTSHSNVYEAHFTAALCRYLLKQQYDPSEITVLTTYSAQMFLLREIMPNKEYGINISVVDNYQGEENEIILLSLVRSNEDDRIGFLKTENRVNVALSRARNGLYVIGNFESFAKQSDIWNNIMCL